MNKIETGCMILFILMNTNYAYTNNIQIIQIIYNYACSRLILKIQRFTFRSKLRVQKQSSSSYIKYLEIIIYLDLLDLCKHSKQLLHSIIKSHG